MLRGLLLGSRIECLSFFFVIFFFFGIGWRRAVGQLGICGLVMSAHEL